MHAEEGVARAYRQRRQALVACVRSISRLLELVREDADGYDGWLSVADRWHGEDER